MRLGCLGVVLALGLIYSGGQGTYESLKNRQQRVMTFEQFAQEKPTGGWIKVTGATLDLTEAMWDDTALNSQSASVYVPVHSAREEDEDEATTEKTMLLLETSDPKIKAGVAEVAALEEKNLSDVDYLEWILDNRNKLFLQREISGTIQFGATGMKSDTREQISKIGETLDPNFVVMNDGAKPELARSLGILTAGLVLAAFMFFLTFRGDGKTKSPPAQARDSAEPLQNQG